MRKAHTKYLAIAVVGAVLSMDIAAADDTPSTWNSIEFTGEVGFEARVFIEDPAQPGQLDHFQGSVFVEPEFTLESKNRDTLINVTPFARFDGADSERTHVDMREAYVRHIDGDWEYLIGANRVFWGVTESRHLVNVINQIDAVENIDEEDFLGQPMAQIARQTDVGRFDAFVMTGFRERTFPGTDGRLRGDVVRGDQATYESDMEIWQPDIALRYSHFIGDVDIGLHAFHGTGREPELIKNDDGTRTPHYVIVNQIGADLQLTRDEWLWKFEGLVRQGQGETFAAAVAGVEYTIFQVAETDSDLGLLAEALYDGRESDVFPTSLENDVFLGARLTFNDVQDTTALAGVVVDWEDGPASFRIEADRRLGDSYKITFETQMFFEDDPSNPASPFEKDSFATLGLSRFF